MCSSFWRSEEKGKAEELRKKRKKRKKEKEKEK